MCKSSISVFLCITLATSGVFAQSSVAKRIAEKKKLELSKEDAQVESALDAMERSLLLVQEEVKRADRWDYNQYYDWITRAGLAVSVLSMGLVVQYRGKGGYYNWGQALMMTSAGGLAVAEVVTLADLLLYPADIDSDKFDQQVAVALGALEEFRKTQEGEKRDQVSEVITLIESLNTTLSEEQKKEIARESLQRIAVVLGLGALATSTGMGSRHADAFTAATLGLGFLAMGATGWASIKSSDNKADILKAVEAALEAVREAKDMM